jgi:hypothetical protein
MTWSQVCKMAECEPGLIDARFTLNKTRAIYWLRARLLARNYNIRALDIEEAYDGRHDA